MRKILDFRNIIEIFIKNPELIFNIGKENGNKHNKRN